MQIGKIYKLDSELLRLTKIHENGIHVFQVVDQFGADVIKKQNGIIIDYGKRIVKSRLCDVVPVEIAEYKQLNLF